MAGKRKNNGAGRKKVDPDHTSDPQPDVNPSVAPKKAEVSDEHAKKGRKRSVFDAEVEEASEKRKISPSLMRKRPRRAAASAAQFNGEAEENPEDEDMIEAKQEDVQVEEAALFSTRSSWSGNNKPQRRLMDLWIHDYDGEVQPIDLLHDRNIYITALMLPFDGPLDKQKGIRCTVGPLESWCISGYEEGVPVIWALTDYADYVCVKPAVRYKTLFSVLRDKCTVTVSVFKALSKPDGGNPDLSFEDLVGRLARSLMGRKSGMEITFSRDYLVGIGKFVTEQLCGLDTNVEGSGKEHQLFSGLPALVTLSNEFSSRMENASAVGRSRNGALTIYETGSSIPVAAEVPVPDECVNDEQLAMLLQEQEERKRDRSRRGAPKPKVYIKMNEDEIARDYPLPEYYKAEEDEVDEYVLIADDYVDPDELPRRMLHDWALYNSDFRFMSLELLPMVAGAETDVEIFGSGITSEDDGSYTLQGDTGGSDPVTEGVKADGMRIYLSSIREWMIEFGGEIISISIRTDGAWYRLGKPSPRYAPWYEPVLRTAKVAIEIIYMLKNESRASRLSFQDVINKSAKPKKLKAKDGTMEEDDKTYIFSNTTEAERYIVVHGQIILQQFAEYPDAMITKSAFVTGLSKKMVEKHHTKLKVTKKKLGGKTGENLNPRAHLQPDAKKSKAMRATTTKLINRIWSEYYEKYSVGDGDRSEEGADAENENTPIDEVEEDEEVEEDDDLTTSSLKTEKISRAPVSSRKRPSCIVKWIGKSIGNTQDGYSLYTKATVRGQTLEPGGTVSYQMENGADVFLMVEYMYESGGSRMAHGRLLVKGENTVLGNTAVKREVFLTEECEDVCLDDANDIVNVQFKRRPWGPEYRKRDAITDEEERERAENRERQGLPIEYLCRALYLPQKGGFFANPHEKLAMGSGACSACDCRAQEQGNMVVTVFPDNTGFKVGGVEYSINDFLYIEAEKMLKSQDEVQKFKAGRNKGLRAFTICQLVAVKSSSNKSAVTQLTVRRFYRPEEVDFAKAYKADIHEVYYSENTTTVTLGLVKGKCNVVKQHEFNVASETIGSHLFYCSCIYDPQKGTIKQLPSNVKLGLTRIMCNNKGKSPDIAKAKGKGKLVEDHMEPDNYENVTKLAMLDIFAGCGGLSEGLHQSGVACTKWAIEYDHAAAEAFKMNHADADVFSENCNVILRCIMENNGDVDDCISTPEADEMVSKLTNLQKSRLPKPGEVDFISGGPPCQGFSGMNRFNQSVWSKVQCEMILAFLSYADYFRPRYFLLENVRNFVSFNKGQTFRLTLSSLLQMGYQVRFGILQAGNYGVAQSRSRAFIWAAAPDLKLPDWPEPMYVFASSQLKVPLSGNSYYAAIKDTGRGAPLRSITVRDTIGDLPHVVNGAGNTEIAYGNEPESWFQKQIRGNIEVLYDHICKEMNELNYLRCQRIPKRPGADWRDLPDEKIKLSTGQTVDLIPWCLPNTAERHNQWKGLFGRLDWDGNFPTSITDPQPMGKVGMCFHPEQDRIVTVRECARSQGFPDCYKFYGNIQSKHRQIGNAVPPPLAKALGQKLKEAVEA